MPLAALVATLLLLLLVVIFLKSVFFLFRWGLIIGLLVVAGLALVRLLSKSRST